MAGELLAPDGRTLRIGDVRQGACTGCGDTALRSVLPIEASSVDHAPFPLALCGGCLAEGLAILLGRRHVQHGGAVDDLTYQPPAA